MQVSIETISGLERCMTIGVPAAEIEEKVTVELKKLSKGRKIDGFRPGKIPPGAVKKMFGKQARYEAVYQQMQQAFFKAVQEQEVKLAGMPKFEPTVDEEGKDLEFKATFEVYPEVKLASFDGIEVEKKVASITAADLETMLTNLRKQSAQWDEVEEAAADGDQVVIDFDGFIDGEAFEGGKAEGYNLTLGSNSMIPGFEAGIEGSTAGTDLSLDLTFPEDYHKEDLQGKSTNFKVAVKAVKKPTLPELNEEFFKSFGIETDNLDTFKEEIGKNMERELDRGTRSLVKQQVIAGLTEANSVEVPSSLVDQEIDRLRQQAVQQFGGGQNLDASMLPAELFKEQAEKRVVVGLIINAIIEQNSLTPSDDKVNELIEDMAATYQDPEQVRQYYANTEQRQQLEALALEDQVVSLVLETAKLTEAESNYEEIVRLSNQGQ